MLAADFFRVAVQKWDVLGDRRGERMMAGVPAVLLFIETQQRKINHPQEIKTIARNSETPLRFQKLSAIEPNLAQNLAGGQPLIGCKQEQIAFFDLRFFGERRLFRFTEELYNRRFPFASFHFDESQSLPAKALRNLSH